MWRLLTLAPRRGPQYNAAANCAGLGIHGPRRGVRIESIRKDVPKCLKRKKL